MKEVLTETALKRLKIGQVDCEIITNPHKALSEKEKQQILSLANQVLYCTTGIDRPVKQVESFLFGIEDKGRVLCLFNSQENLVGFASFHLLNKDGEFITYKGRTILHAGSGHILPKFQGSGLWIKSTKYYLNSLPEQIRPKYIEGLTQSPRFLRLITLITNGRVYPNLEDKNIENLKNLQSKILPKILKEKDFLEKIRKGCVVSGINEKVYSSQILSRSIYDDFFYSQLKVKPEKGEFLHFVGIIDNLY